MVKPFNVLVAVLATAGPSVEAGALKNKNYAFSPAREILDIFLGIKESHRNLAWAEFIADSLVLTNEIKCLSLIEKLYRNENASAFECLASV
jgi:hypothetical protein